MNVVSIMSIINDYFTQCCIKVFNEKSDLLASLSHPNSTWWYREGGIRVCNQ